MPFLGQPVGLYVRRHLGRHGFSVCADKVTVTDWPTACYDVKAYCS